MPNIRTSGEQAQQISKAANVVVTSAVQKKVTVVPETTSVLLIGITVSTGAVFQRSFPNLTNAQAWISTQGSDVDVQRVEFVTFSA